MATRTITITRLAQQISNPNGPQNFTLSYTQQITASGAVSMPNEIFRMNSRPLDPNNPTGPLQTYFEAVCTPLDLTTLPINNPNPGPITQFRVASFTLVNGNQKDANQAWTNIQADIQSLKTALDQADVLQIQQTFVPT
jgi:hypothetical protein